MPLACCGPCCCKRGPPALLLVAAGVALACGLTGALWLAARGPPVLAGPEGRGRSGGLPGATSSTTTLTSSTSTTFSTTVTTATSTTATTTTTRTTTSTTMTTTTVTLTTTTMTTTTTLGLEACANVDGVATTYAYPFGNSVLLEGSTAPLRTFYMYRAVSDQAYPPLNVNAGNLAGVLWYLHHEVVIQYPRKFGITRILRFKVNMRSTQPLQDQGMEFGVRFAFDSGRSTGPFACGCKSKNASMEEPGGRFELCEEPYGPTIAMAGRLEWAHYGFFVGCNKLGNFPYPTTPVYYPDATWYSLPGKCNLMPYWAHWAECDAQQPGGYCTGTPTGTGDCTWNYEMAGEIGLDELVGIPDIERFHAEARREYDPETDEGVDFSWWNGIDNQTADAERLAQARALFARKYPNETKDEDMLPPPCDFNAKRFYQALGLADV